MGCNIPRPWKRPKKPYNDGIYGVVTAMEVRKRYFSDPAEETKPIYINGEEIGNVKTREKDPTPEPPRSPYNCPNCCAPIVKDYCEYCGTRFGFSVVKIDRVPKRAEIEKLKERLYADDQIVMEFDRFNKVAYDLGDPTTWTEDIPVGIVDTKND
ncbi:MAG: hypothetical protein VZR54_07080 [Ruminococcus sp.]|nr:hypothetical protein [Ruminococcus sp.]